MLMGDAGRYQSEGADHAIPPPPTTHHEHHNEGLCTRNRRAFYFNGKIHSKIQRNDNIPKIKFSGVIQEKTERLQQPATYMKYIKSKIYKKAPI